MKWEKNVARQKTKKQKTNLSQADAERHTKNFQEFPKADKVLDKTIPRAYRKEEEEERKTCEMKQRSAQKQTGAVVQ